MSRLAARTHLTGQERFFDPADIIVSKTDLKGRITYANETFLKIAGYAEAEVLGQPHSIIRHPAMPRAVFKLLWDTLAEKKEIFAYVVNRSQNGDHYWVLAHVTPSFAPDGTVLGYHSNRRVPERRIVEQIITPLYKTLLDEENRHASARDGMNAAFGLLAKLLKEKGMSYDRLVFSL